MHVDMDSFYAACEERENPSLKGKPVVIYIGTGPKGTGKTRGVVSTANYIARKYGIHSGMPISTAKKKCPQAIFVTANFDLYESVSERIMNILRKHADALEEAGIDEAYLDVSSKGSYKEAEKLAVKIKAEIFKKEKLTCSIGIGPNKLIAKIASDYQKPNGLTVIPPGKVLDFIRPMKVRKLWGVGPKTEQRLREHFGIETVAQLEKIPKKNLIEVFGPAYGQFLYESARGIDTSPIVEEYKPKSFSREVTFEKDTRDISLLHSTLDQLSKDVHRMLTEEGFMYKTVTLIIRYEDFEQHTRASTLKDATDELQPIINISKELLKPFLKKPKKIRKIGVRVSNLKEKKLSQPNSKKTLPSIRSFIKKS